MTGMDTAARNRIVEENLGLAYEAAGRLRRKLHLDWGDLDDITQIALRELIRAAELYNPSKGNKFSTYAMACMEKRLRREAAMIRLLVHIPGRCSGTEFRDIIRGFRFQSLDSVGAATAPTSTVPGSTEAENVVDGTESLWAQIEKVVTRRQYQALRMIYGPEGAGSQTEAAKFLGINQGSLSRLLKSARERLLAWRGK